MPIRNAAKAIIIHNGSILVNKNLNTLGDMCYGLSNGAIYYDLPGGGQNQYETLEEAVKRECMEESGYTVSVSRLAAIYEEISTHERFRREYPQYAHKIYFVFLCRLASETVAPTTEKDLDMLSSEWIRIENIKNIPLYPSVIRERIAEILDSEAVLNLGFERV